MRIALVTCAKPTEYDPDAGVLRKGFQSAGIAAEAPAWDDPLVDWERFDLCVLRSCWNLYTQPLKFLEWAKNVRRLTPIMNPLHIISWNTHKQYLDELARCDIPIVPTVWLPANSHGTLQAAVDQLDCKDIVIKPAISAASYRTRRFRSDDSQAADFLGDLLADGDVMVQKYISAVEDGHEHALVWINGMITHGVIKHARFEGQPERVTPLSCLKDDEIGFALRALSHVVDLCYARVDIIRDQDGSLLLSELELIDPCLFLGYSKEGTARFVDVVRQQALASRCQAH